MAKYQDITKRYFRILSFVTLIFIYAVTFFAIYLLFPLFKFQHILLNLLAADVAATVIIFFFSMIFNNSSVYDPFWSLVPPILTIFLMTGSPQGNNARQWIILILVASWSLRLTINWFRGWQGLGNQDWRYTYIEKRSGKWYWLVSFFGIHLIPTLVVFLGCLPLWYAIRGNKPLNFYDIIAALFTFASIMTEWMADEQLIRFRKRGFNHNYIKSGLWAYSRHPNYLGEIAFWAGLFMFTLSSAALHSPNGLWTIIGLVSMILLFKFISIPVMEKRNIMQKEGYQQYMKQVPALLPNLGKKGKINTNFQ